jgi:hypothetical protein
MNGLEEKPNKKTYCRQRDQTKKRVFGRRFEAKRFGRLKERPHRFEKKRRDREREKAKKYIFQWPYNEVRTRRRCLKRSEEGGEALSFLSYPKKRRKQQYRCNQYHRAKLSAKMKGEKKKTSIQTSEQGQSSSAQTCATASDFSSSTTMIFSPLILSYNQNKGETIKTVCNTSTIRTHLEKLFGVGS